MPHKYRVFFGFDANEMRACNVAMHSMFAHTSRREVREDRISRHTLGARYTRPTSRMPNGQLFDDISGAPMSTDHALARFWVPLVCGYEGLALFVDGDILVRADIRALFAEADAQYAVQVVQHPPLMDEGDKKDGHFQQAYPKKNWSSCILWHAGHPANAALTLDVLNTWPGRDLHAFKWLDESLIGPLSPKWNYLARVSPPQDDPAIVHYTTGCPDVAGHEHDPFADEWRDAAVMAGYRDFVGGTTASDSALVPSKSV